MTNRLAQSNLGQSLRNFRLTIKADAYSIHHYSNQTIERSETDENTWCSAQ